jgi:hypothetical protein
MAQIPRVSYGRGYGHDSRPGVIRQGAPTKIPGLAEQRREISGGTALGECPRALQPTRFRNASVSVPHTTPRGATIRR